jgi:hypothetical protein
VRAKPTGWWITRKKDEDEALRPPPLPSKSVHWLSTLKKNKADQPQPHGPPTTMLTRSKSVGGEVAYARNAHPPPPPPRAHTADSGKRSGSYVANSAQMCELGVMTTAQAPIWLLNATQALDVLVSEHPKVMTALSAILITLGSIPAIPAISAGAGGAVLASGTAHAVGAIAVGLGSWMKAHQDARARHPSH